MGEGSPISRTGGGSEDELFIKVDELASSNIRVVGGAGGGMVGRERLFEGVGEVN